MSDYENDNKRELDITDPSGVETKIAPCCGSTCACASSDEKCKGEVLYRLSLSMHLCWGCLYNIMEYEGDFSEAKELSNWGGEYEQDDYNEKQEEHHGGWYESKPSDKETESID